MKKFEIYTRQNRFAGKRKATGIIVEASSKKEACNL
jgi:hypothetical protein